ncbi:SusC/RagA family TonB-linked outer membrane protein [Salisaeta longa]|uniref:SusC/RagA family TonB-linked outer membrane protein n=1 Tax=Salisaeta longa TaxID=503170 RepID=UPI00048DF5D3|nr:TonB-dependent receptor [Salisaeta longa]
MLWKRLLSLVVWFALGAAALPSTAAHAQSGTISGVVTEAEGGAPLPGANVVVVGTTNGASTNAEGRYSFSVAPGTYTLQASFVGYRTELKEAIVVTAGETTTVNFAMQTGMQLDEMVVVGYGEQERRNLTGSVASVSAEEIEDRPIESVEEALQGKAAGINIVQNSGSPGSAFTVRIRGTGTIGNNTPLYVVDGIPVNGDISYLNPNDIASIDVLKGAASAAIYGTQAANGAVLITTKSGNPGERSVTFRSSLGVQETPRTIDMLSAAQYATLRNEALINDGSPPAYSNPAEFVGRSTNWQNAIFRTGLIQDYGLAVSGGEESFTYRLSGSYMREGGIIEGSSYERYNVQLNSTFDVSPLLTVGERITLTNSARQTLPETDDVRNIMIQTLQMDPTVPVFNADGSYTAPRFSNTQNPVAVIDFNNNTFRINRFVGNAFAELTPLDGLTVRSDVGLDVRYGNNYYFLPTYNVSPDFTNPNSVVARYSDRVRSIVWNNTATYTRAFGSHDMTLLGGTTVETNNYQFIDASTLGTPSNDPSLRYLSSGTQINGAAGSASNSRLLSFFGRANYNYSNRYLLTLVARYDGSSRFGSQNRFAFFPSVSAAWRVSNEPFFPETDVVSDLKLRVGWGQNGNQEVGDYTFAALITSGQDYPLGTGESRVPGSAPLGAPAPDLKWETTTQSNIGLDASLLDQRFNVTLDYFIKTTDDVLLYPPNIPTSGLTSLSPSNIGKIENRGFEASVNYYGEALDGDFTYDVGVNFSALDNEVIRLVEGVDIVQGFYRQGAITLTQAGSDVGAFYGWVTDGIFQTQQAIEEANARDGDASTPYQPDARPGDIRFKDLNGDGRVNDEDRTFIGSPTPDFSYGFTSRLSFRGLSLSLFLQGTQGNEIFAAYKYYTEGAALFNLSEAALDRWTGPGTSNTMPRLTANDPNQNTRISDRYVEDGSYLRLKNVQLGYTLPTSLLTRIGGLQKARVYVGAQNLLTITGYDGYTPEIGVGDDEAATLDRGIDRATYPQPRIYTVGLNLTF